MASGTVTVTVNGRPPAMSASIAQPSYVIKWGDLYFKGYGGWGERYGAKRDARKETRSSALEALKALRERHPHRAYTLVRLAPKAPPEKEDMSKALYLSRVLALWEESGLTSFGVFLANALPCGYLGMTDTEIIRLMRNNVEAAK